MPFDTDHLINPALLTLTKQASVRLGGFRKQAFVPGGDPSMGGAPPGGGDPAAGGAPPGGDPAAMGAPPPDPAAGGGGGGMDPAQMQQMVQQAVQQAMAGQGGAGGAGAGAGAGALKPKVDVNSVLLQILKIQARIADQLGVKIPASEMVVTQQDQMGLANATQTGQPMPGMDPTAAAGGGGGAGGAGGGAIGGMPPMDPMQGAGTPGGEKTGSYRGNGTAFDTAGLGDITNKAAAIARLRKSRS